MTACGEPVETASDNGDAKAPERKVKRAVLVRFEGAGKEVHRRRADEAGDELIGRVVVELERRADLRDQTVLHHDDAVGERHRLDLVVGDVDRGDVEGLCSRLISMRIWLRSLASRLESGSSNRKT